jgi:hypothetical protein
LHLQACQGLEAAHGNLLFERPPVLSAARVNGLVAANEAADIFVVLTRAYSASINAAGEPASTGIGWDGSITRAFLMTVPNIIAAIGFPGHLTVNYRAKATFSQVTNGTD